MIAHASKPLARSGLNAPRLSIFFQLDPFNPTIGGIQTCIKYIIKYAPSTLRIQLVGIIQGRETNSSLAAESAIGKWQTAQLYGREFDFLPLLKVVDDNVRQRVPTTLKYAWALRKYLRQQTIPSEIYQFHRIEPTIFTRSLGNNSTKLLYIHNDIHQEIKGKKTQGGILWKRIPWAYFALERYLVGQFDRILSCNSQSAQLYQQQYPTIANRVSYLPNTYDDELFYPLNASEKNQARKRLAQTLNLSEDTRFILFAGRLHPQKRPDLLIQAMAALPKLPFSPHLLIVGKGELEPVVCAEIKRLGIASQVTLLGSMPQSKLADLYRLSDLFVLTSAYEGLARGSLEALACGTPVVTTPAGETPNFLTADSGIVCNEQSIAKMPDAIARAWHRVLQNPSAYPASACTRVAAPYSAKHVVSTLYGGLVETLSADQSGSSQLTQSRENAVLSSR